MRLAGLTPRSGTGALALGASSGTLLLVATSPIGLGFLAFAALAPVLVAAVHAGSIRRAAAAGFACGLVFQGCGFLWVPLQLGGRVWLLWILVAPLLALPIAAWAAAVALVARRRGAAAALCVAPALWAAIEVLRAIGPFGIGWLRLGQAVADWPVWIQLAAPGGVELVSAWIAASAAALAHAIATRRRGAWALAAAVPAVGTAFGAIALAGVDARPPSVFRVAAVQPDVPAAERFVPARFDQNLERLVSLSRSAAADGAADLVAWPEASFELPAGPRGAPFLGAIATTIDTPIVAGVRRIALPDTRLRWNSAVIAEATGETRVAADKRHPIPLYERAPDGWLAGAFARATTMPGRVLAGAPAEPQSITARDGTLRRVGVLVCVDSSFPEVARDLRRRGADLIVSIANEAESGPWSARQHAALVRLRAVETGLPLVRVANGGPSVWIDPLGREIDRTGSGAVAHTAAVGPPLAPPLYVSLGDAPVVAALFIPGLLTAIGVGRDARVRPRRLEERISS